MELVEEVVEEVGLAGQEDGEQANDVIGNHRRHIHGYTNRVYG